MKRTDFLFPVIASIIVLAIVIFANKYDSQDSQPKQNILATSNRMPLNDENCIYYWRTTFNLNDYERKFLKDNNITKMYMRFFDVVKSDIDSLCYPNATIVFNDSAIITARLFRLFS